MTSKITMCEFNHHPHMLPLVSGYLQAYSQKDPEVESETEFELFTRTANTSADNIIEELVSRQSDVYAISCYIWNMGLIRKLLDPIIERVPHARIILGGPQVQGRAETYIRPEQNRIFIANGEGEVIFYEFIKEVIAGGKNFRNCPGLNFWDMKLLTTTPSPPLIKDLDDIPSPFLTGIFDDMPFVNVAYETNRGCPYTCSFCYFSRGGEYRKLRKFSQERVSKEMDWLTSRDLMYIFMADANWGVFKQDIVYSQELANYAKKRGSPTFVSFSAAKNRPNAVLEIAQIFKDAGITNSQPVSFQSLNPEVLKLISRINIKADKIDELQTLFSEQHIDSYVEMIWPLPGETLESFKQGLEVICNKGLGTITCYPTIMLPNTALWDQEEEFGFVTLEPEDALNDSKIVIQTNWVTEAEYEEGVRYYFATHILFNLGTLRCLSNYLHHDCNIPMNKLFTDFADYMKAHQENDLAFWIEDFIIEKGGFVDNGSLGMCAHRILHEERDKFQPFLYQFVSEQPWWSDKKAQMLFEVDILNTPYLYSTLPVRGNDCFENHLKYITVIENKSGRCVAEIPSKYKKFIPQYVYSESEVNDCLNASCYEILYITNQIPYMPSWSKEQVGNYGQGRIQSNRSLMPRWEPLANAQSEQQATDDEMFVEEVF